MHAIFRCLVASASIRSNCVSMRPPSHLEKLLRSPSSVTDASRCQHRHSPTPASDRRREWSGHGEGQRPPGGAWSANRLSLCCDNSVGAVIFLRCWLRRPCRGWQPIWDDTLRNASHLAVCLVKKVILDDVVKEMRLRGCMLQVLLRQPQHVLQLLHNDNRPVLACQDYRRVPGPIIRVNRVHPKK